MAKVSTRVFSTGLTHLLKFFNILALALRTERQSGLDQYGPKHNRLASPGLKVVGSVICILLFPLDSSVARCSAEPTQRAAGAVENLLVIRACQEGPQDVHACQRADSGAQVGGGERASLEAVDEAAACVVGAPRPDSRSPVGRRPCQERDDCERRAAGGAGRDGARGVPQTSTQCRLECFRTKTLDELLFENSLLDLQNASF